MYIPTQPGELTRLKFFDFVLVFVLMMKNTNFFGAGALSRGLNRAHLKFVVVSGNAACLFICLKQVLAYFLFIRGLIFADIRHVRQEAAHRRQFFATEVVSGERRVHTTHTADTTNSSGRPQ